MEHELLLTELNDRRRAALEMGGRAKLEARRARGLLDARTRLALLFDEGRFDELGMFAVSARAEDAHSTPADGKVAGFGTIQGRPVAAVANDFTVKGASSSSVNTEKILHVKEIATRTGQPIVFLGESTGARMPDIMGARGIGKGSRPQQYRRERETPWASAVLGPCYGSSAWYASMSDFVTMRKGAVLGVASPVLTSSATGELTDAEALGGWAVHTQKSGLVDVACDTEAEAIGLVRTFLSYLPSSRDSAPPTVESLPPEGEADDILRVLPAERRSAYDVRDVLRLIVDEGSLFPLKPGFGRSVVTALARVGGRSVGIVASNPISKGGAIDVDACNKVVSFLVLCDSFNVPIVFMVDQPGFMIGADGERRGATGRVMNWMNALSLVTVPKISIVMRKTYGQALLNMGGGGNAHEVAAWVTAEVNFMDPDHAVKIVHGIDRDSDPERFAVLRDEMALGTTAFDYAQVYGAHDVIDPRATRDYILSRLRIHHLYRSDGVGERLMSAWPTTY